MSDTTPRFALPLLAAGQAQKEITHNEALILLDLLSQPVVEDASLSIPPMSPGVGQAWIVPAGAGGAWTGHTGALALWTDGGWRFISAPEGMRAIVRATGLLMRRSATMWESGGAIAAPTGGSVIDTQARGAIASIIAALQQAGSIPA